MEMRRIGNPPYPPYAGRPSFKGGNQIGIQASPFGKGGSRGIFWRPHYAIGNPPYPPFFKEGDCSDSGPVGSL